MAQTPEVYIEGQASPILRWDLLIAPVGQGYTTLDLATDLEGLIIEYVSEGLYGKRYRWTKDEEGNNFELSVRYSKYTKAATLSSNFVAEIYSTATASAQ